MNKWLLVVIFAAMAVAPLGASPITACSSMTLDALVGLGATGCLAQDVIFSNFSYSHTGALTPVQASQITANLISAEDPVNGDQHGWIFNGPVTGWGASSTFILSYDARVVSKRPFVIAQLQTVNTPPNARVAVNEELNGGAVPDLNVWYTSFADQHLTDFDTYAIPGYWQFNVKNTGTPTTGAITRFDNYFYQTPSDVPEPAAQVLTGSALLALSLFLKRFKRS